MSVCIALLPVALAMRIVMGKKNFENWVSAQQVRVPSNFTTELELTRTVKKAGYDAIKFGSSIKTHIDGEKSFFFWELVDNKWVAIFSKNQDKAMLDRFKSVVESVADRRVFGELPAAAVTVSAQFPTNFRDADLLMKALTEFGALPVKRSNGSVLCKIQNTSLIFNQIGNSPYMVEVKDGPNLEQVYQYMADIDDDYKRCVQTAVYEKVKSRAAERDMTIESEEVLPDKTILMTLRVS
jgi:hypothetical protein